MSYRGLLTDHCDIYHLKHRIKPAHYGLPGESEFYYEETPDASGVSSFWSSRGSNLVQGEPAMKLSESFLVHFAMDTDVRANDRVVYQGATYVLQLPRIIRNHHIEVVAMREEML
ncbi:DUF3599 family protein [Brevibacillus dissolubilis]|uniref:DUF3599 family protein n=1 Tax=Brevibacillus dissolubilis TaxID=1844116 RepID=UPI00111675EB|nr:DUF3599 family protein [Brevibacillus dissolubilis]